MYVLYLDESGDPDALGHQDNHFVLGGVAVFEGDIHGITQQIEDLQQKLYPTIRIPIEFHAQHICRGKDRWRNEPEAERQRVMESLYQVIAAQHFPGFVMFATAVHVSWPSTPQQALDDAFQDVCQRFNTFLMRQFNAGYPSKGLIVVDKSGRERRYRELQSTFQTQGMKHGYLDNVVDIPYFAESHHTRLIQLADLCAYAVLLHYEGRESRYFQTILPRFDRRSSTSPPDALKHFTRIPCNCEACCWR